MGKSCQVVEIERAEVAAWRVYVKTETLTGHWPCHHAVVMEKLVGCYRSLAVAHTVARSLGGQQVYV